MHNGRPLRLIRAVGRLVALLSAVLMSACTVSGDGHAQAAPTGAKLERVLAAATLERPVHLAPVPGSNDVVVVEQAGRIRRFGGWDGSEGRVWLDLRGRVSDEGWEEGLLSIAFHPGFPARPYVYVYYSAAEPRRSVLARFRTDAKGMMADPVSEQVVLEVPQPFSNHNGGQLAFGPDGMLYVGLGDGGAGGDPHGNGQDPGTLLGALLRIDVRAPRDGRPYAIPPDNPFADGRQGRPEVWAYGLRNPWRFSFDRATGALYAGDVGQNAVEEVDRIVRGGNYGWNVMEGSRCYEPPEGCERTGLILPIAEYTHEVGRSITGGYVYRGESMPGLVGRYLLADYSSGTVWSIPTTGHGLRKPEVLLDTDLNIASFAQDPAGELYVLDHRGGRVFRLAPSP